MVIITFNASSGESLSYAQPLMVVLSTVSKRPLDTAANAVTAEAADVYKRQAYGTGTYEVDENDLSGSHAADLLGVEHDRMYKTLVLKGEKKGYLVCCIPVDEELDLKKAARAAGEKKVEMIHVRDMLAVTGYIRGGCSPIGMKKHFPTYIRCV